MPVRPGRPTAIRIPSLHVDARVTPIRDDSRVLVPPPDYTTVGWWSAGARPGASHGTSILAGHTVHTGGGAFDDLDQLYDGQRVVIQLPDRDLMYRISSVTVYLKGTLAARSPDVFAQTGPGRLALVTCADWNGEAYLSNVVVMATAPRVATAG